MAMVGTDNNQQRAVKTVATAIVSSCSGSGDGSGGGGSGGGSGHSGDILKSTKSSKNGGGGGSEYSSGGGGGGAAAAVALATEEAADYNQQRGKDSIYTVRDPHIQIGDNLAQLKMMCLVND